MALQHNRPNEKKQRGNYQTINCNTNMNKKLVKITESRLCKVISESIKNILLFEDYDTQDIFNAAKKTFGCTYNIMEAGYVLPDGTMLDFSGRHEGADEITARGRRSTDHRDICQIGYQYDAEGNETETGIRTNMQDFIRRGAIRIDANSGLINLFSKPTMQQKKVLRLLVTKNRGDVWVDFGDGWNSESYAEYEGVNPSRVLADIDRYFDEGIKPTGNV